MMYRSTRGSGLHTLDDVLLRGIAEDGGLFVPDSFPAFTDDDFSDGDATGFFDELY